VAQSDIELKKRAARRRWSREDYQADPIALAQSLLGQILVHLTASGRRVAGRIVETEAYLGVEDLAAHSVGGRRTARNEVMYGRPGLAYVFFTYGMHHCFNVVCGREEVPVAVLIRALEPLEGLDQMRRRRARASKKRVTIPADEELCSGPARLCQALAIDLRHNGIDLATSKQLFIEKVERRGRDPWPIVATPRIGIEYAREWATKPLRWYLMENPHVSR